MTPDCSSYQRLWVLQWERNCKNHYGAPNKTRRLAEIAVAEVSDDGKQKHDSNDRR